MTQENSMRSLSAEELDWLGRMKKLTADHGSLREGFGLSLDTAVALCENAGRLLEHGHNDEALILFEGLVSLDPGEPYFQVCLGCTLMKVGRAEEAAAHFRKALAIRPRDVTALAYLGEILLETKQFDEANKLLLAAVAEDPKERDPYANRARRLLKVLKSEAVGLKAKKG